MYVFVLTGALALVSTAAAHSNDAMRKMVTCPIVSHWLLTFRLAAT